jgi:hypothetical protein
VRIGRKRAFWWIKKKMKYEERKLSRHANNKMLTMKILFSCPFYFNVQFCME